ncbi:MAG TPA: UDP-N-acetylmuramate--L-alanine ligase [Anaerolineaceae bacterium]|nr:UDP-N-acetylmuramate--L-alanine ligase [Anaerolineaceae bacterium]
MTHVHLIGIGGTGLSAIAWVLVEKGYTVSGSDRTLSPLARNLQSAGVEVSLGHKAENILGADIVLRSSAIPDNNPEVLAARQAGIPVYKRADFLGQLMADHLGIAVAGTHGKTTTTAMIAWMLTAIGQDPTYVVGSVLQNLGANAHAGQGPAFVIEADEYDYMFLGLNPQVSVVTSVEHDHPDLFPTGRKYRQAFLDFVKRLPAKGILLACSDDPGAAEILSKSLSLGIHGLSYGTGAHADYQARSLQANALGGYTFTAAVSAQPMAQIQMQIPGEHNVRNALAAFAVAEVLGLPLEESAQALSAFRGTSRRFEIRGIAQGITVIDDYAHHPTEIRATLTAARSRFPGQRIWAVWQPHTYSRTRALFDEFAASFKDADHVIVSEVYAAREPAQPFSAAQVVKEMDHPGARFVAGLSEIAGALVKELRAGDVLIVLSAGDADQVSTQVLAAIRERMGQNA